MHDRRELSKVVKVSDPENWYNQKTVTVKLFVCPEHRGETDVRIFVESIDDFAMELLKKKHDEDINWLFNMICDNKTEVSRFYNQYQSHLVSYHKDAEED